MKQTILGASLIVVTAAGAFGQSAASPLTFEVASVKASAPPKGNNIMIRRGGDAGRLDYANQTLRDYIRIAYRVKAYQVSGPDWLDLQRYDIVAKLPAGASQEQVPEMLQALLAERFKLALHRETKELPAYALVAGKNGPKMKEVEMPSGPVTGPGGGPGGLRGRMMIGRGQIAAKQMTVGNFVELLSRFVDRPVMDMTELKGAYDFKLEFTPEAGDRAMQKLGMEAGMAPGAPRPAEGAPEPSGPSIFTAVQEQLGLKLEARKAPLEILVIDRAEKVPTEN